MISIIDKIRNDPEYKKVNSTISTIICLGCLGLAQVLKGTIIAVFPHLLAVFFFCQFFGSSIQGSLSDIYKRSTVLNISLVLLILLISFMVISHGSQTPLINWFQKICIFFIGLGGNADVVGRAEIIDLHYHLDRRKIMSWTVFAEAFSWVIVGFFIRYLNFEPFNILIICIIASVILLTLSLLFNIDTTADKKHLHNPENEIKLIIKENWKKILLVTILIIVSEFAYFFFFYNQENRINNPKLLADSYMSWFIGMSLGCWILNKFKSSQDFWFLVYGFAISLFAIVLFILLGMKNITVPKMFYTDSLIYFVAGFGSGIYLPCFYSLISRGYSIHFQGTLTGWIDSLRVFGDALTNAMLAGLAIFSGLAPIFVSGFLFLLSLILIVISRRKIE